MDRRGFLAGAATLGAVALAGCTGRDGGPGGAGGEPTETAGDPTATPTPTLMPWEPASTEPHATATVGDRSSVVLPEENTDHGVMIWNDADVDRDLRVVVVNDETRFDETFPTPADGYVTLSLAEPAAYSLTVSADGTEVGTFEVDTGFFDCNSSSTAVQVTAGGDLNHRTQTTLEYCQEPALATASLESGDGTCGSGGDASVAFDGTTVSLSGRVAAPTPCHRAVLADAAFDDDRETLTLTVGVHDTGADVCADCIGEVPYEATVAFEQSLPDRVVVVHGEGQDGKQVAEASP